MKRRLFIVFLLLNTCLLSNAQQERFGAILSVEAMNEDFNYLRQRVEASCPGLYIYQTPERVRILFDSVKNTLQQPLPFLAFYSKISFIMAQLHCEHSYANLGKGAGELRDHFSYFPFQPNFTGPNPIVIINGTSDTTIKPGDEIVSVNGKPINSIRDELFKYIPADAFITTSKAHALSSMQFSFLYNLFIEQAKAYDVVFKNKAGQIINRHFKKDLGLKQINKNALKNPVNKPVLDISNRFKEIRKEDFRLDFVPEKKTAFLTVQTFSTNKEAFKNKMDDFFKQIKQNGSLNLVIDLCYNGGGDEDLVAILMSHLVSAPTKLVEDEYLLTDKDEYLVQANIPAPVLKNKYAYIDTLRNGRSQVKISEYSGELETIQPAADNFTGKVCLYVNGMTSSAASTFAAIAQSNKRAIVVGEETAGGFKGGGTVIGLDLSLPNSGIKTHASIVYMVFATHGRDSSRGVIPDFAYVPGLDELIGDSMAWKRYVMSLF